MRELADQNPNWLSIAVILEDQSGEGFFRGEERSTERTDWVETAGPVRQWDTRPVSAEQTTLFHTINNYNYSYFGKNAKKKIVMT